MKKTFLITGAVVVLAACLFRVEFTQKSTAQEQRRQNLPGAHHLNKRIESLPDATVELRLLVLDESGQPVQGAQAVMKLDGGMKAESTILALGETDSGGARLTGASDAQGRLNWKVPAPFILPDTYISVSRFDRQLIGGVSLGDTPKAWKKPEPFEVTARLIKARRITGIVVDAAGKPVENAMVNANFAAPLSCVSTDSQGRFVLDVSPYQPRESLFAYKRGLGAGMISPDYPLEEAWKAVGDGSDWDRWKKNRNDGPFTIKIERGETISVRVVDTEGNPIEGISVHPSYFSTKTSFWNMWNFNELFPCRTDKDGRVVFDWIPTQRYSYITFSAQGTDPRIDKEGKTRLYGAADAVWRDTLKNNDLLISLPKKITLEGSVRNADGSPPPVGMQISFTGKNWSSCGINTDYDGNFTFFVNADEIVSANPISNRSRNPGVGVGKALQNVDVGDGSKPAPRFDFVLEKGTKVLGKILAGNPEKPFEKMYVQIFDVAFDQKAELSDMNRVFGMIEVDEKGEYETRLPAGVYRFKVDDKEIGGTLEINGEDEKRFDLKDR